MQTLRCLGIHELLRFKHMKQAETLKWFGDVSLKELVTFVLHRRIADAVGGVMRDPDG
jgi:hypothetical protein